MKAKAKRGGHFKKKSVKKELKIEKKIFIEEPPSGDISKLPCFEMRITHEGEKHEPQKPSDEIGYAYKLPMSSDTVTLDDDKINELASSDDDSDEVTYEDQHKTVTVKKSLIDDYRKKSNYYGPLRIISEKIKVKDQGVLKEAIQAKLQHVELQATDNDGNPVDEHELKILMSQTPGIIPACDPAQSEITKSDGYMVLYLGNEEKYKVLKKALHAFQKAANVKPPFNTKIQKIFISNEDGMKPVTIVSLYPRVDKIIYRTAAQDDIKQSIRKIIASKKDKAKPKLVNYYRQNYINWAHRGSICFSEIKKVGMDFVDEILVENLLIEDTLKLLGCGLSKSSLNLDPIEVDENEIEEFNYAVGSREFVEEVWSYLTNLVRSDSFLIEFEFEMDEEKWLEIKRAFNMFQVNGEVIPDILLKVVLKKKDDKFELTYFIRSLGRLIKYGPVLSKADINDMLKCLAKDKYICVGFNRSNFLLQADQNEMLRMHLKENASLTMLPFESLHSKRCKGIVRDQDNIENAKIQRGSITAFGPPVMCQQCHLLQIKLKELVDPTLNLYGPQEVAQRYIKQRYGPLHTINISDNIKSLFTMTPSEFVSGVKRKLVNSRIAENEDSVIKQIKSVDENADIFDNGKPSIKVTEEEFEKMITVKKYSKSSNALRKECEVCGFQAKSLLVLFVHMNDHLGPLSEECENCNLKLSSKEALFNHKEICVHLRKNLKCSDCHNIFPSKEKLYEHTNVHRKVKPFRCSICNSELQSMNEYKKHVKRVHFINSVKELNFHCAVCNSYFYTSDHLLIHKLNQDHAEKEHFKCKICNFSCGLVSAFKLHIISHTFEQRESNNLAICLICQRVFFSSFRLEEHSRTKHPDVISTTIEKPTVSTDLVEQTSTDPLAFEGYTCSKCFKVYGSLNSLQKHIDNYHIEKNLAPTVPLVTVACNVCGRKFNSEYFLASHMKLHAANRPVFQCEECGFVYAKRTQVLEHIRNDHAEQVEKHQQMQQQRQQQIPQQHELLTESHVYATQQAYTGGQVLSLDNQPEALQPQNQDNWNQIKIGSVEQTQEVTYSFPQFF